MARLIDIDSPTIRHPIGYLYTIPEVAATLNLSISQIRNLIRSGKLISVKIPFPDSPGKSTRIPAKALESFILAYNPRFNLKLLEYKK